MSDLQSVIDFTFSIGRNGRKLLSSTSSTPAPSASYVNEATLDPDRLVILAVVALLTLLLFGIFLNSLLRCLLRCRRQTVLDSISDGEGNDGLKKAAIKALPVIVYTATSKPRTIPMDCPICLAEFAEGESMRVLPQCNHGFNMECVDKWLVSHSSCPMCRHCLNLHIQNKKWAGAAIAEATESNNNIMHIVIENATDSNHGAIGSVSPQAETFK